MTDTTLVAAVRAAIKTESLDRFASEHLADDARDWLAGFAARAAVRVVTEHVASAIEALHYDAPAAKTAQATAARIARGGGAL